MATFDPTTQTITLRIVYDGLGMAGKTTNLRQLHELLSDAQRGDLYIPEERRGRTLYFDWLEVEAGLFDGIRVRCQLLTVPGQFSYAQRRWHLLNAPDAIIAVVDSTPQGIVRARYALRFLEEAIAHQNPRIPLVVQANKQDAEGALPGHEVREALGVPQGSRVVEASALQGVGVRATLIFALQGARERLRALTLDRGVDALPVGTETAEEVYHQMLRQELAGDENRQGEVIIDRVLRDLEGSPLTSLTPPPPSSGDATPISSIPPTSPSAAHPPASPAAPLAAPLAAAAAGPASVAGPASGAAEAAPAAPTPVGVTGPRSAFPTAQAPLALWPAAGRVTLQEVREAGTMAFHQAHEDDGGQILEFRAGSWAFLVRSGVSYRDKTQGALAMRQLAEARVVAADLLPSPFVLTVQPVIDGAETELWALRATLEPAYRPGETPDEAGAAALARYVARTLGLAARHGVLLSLDPGRLTRVPQGLAALSLPLPITSWIPAHLAPLVRWAGQLPDASRIDELARELRQAIERELSAEEQARLDWPLLLEKLDRTSPGEAAFVAGMIQLRPMFSGARVSHGVVSSSTLSRANAA